MVCEDSSLGSAVPMKAGKMSYENSSYFFLVHRKIILKNWFKYFNFFELMRESLVPKFQNTTLEQMKF